ncbi:adenylate cyclase [Ceratobasidium sp. AG-Ba]|nr:adenylate cyclase [Ceratobasidium sp. AG-Ba]
MDFGFGVKKAYRPPTYQCSWWTALRNLPRRIGTPPVADGKHKHRSCNIVPIFRVSLNDILDGKHLPPLSLKDFEEYLLFDERSAENLYFVLWLKEYTKRHRAWFSTATTHSRSLALSFTRAKSTFFSHSSTHELNLPSILIFNFFAAAEGQPHPPPPIFNQILREVEHMLRESLLRFVASRTRNAGKQRVWCALIGGIGVSLIALAPLLVTILGNKPRALRLAALPILWLGATIFLSSIHGICFIIYILGDARQLYPFELSRPPISSPRPIDAETAAHIPAQISGFTLGHAYTASTDIEKPIPIRQVSMTDSNPSPITPADIYVSSPFPASPTTLPKSFTSARFHHSRNTSTTSGMSIPTIPPYSPSISSPFDSAPFIAPFDPKSLEINEKGPVPSQPVFNFDELPGRRRVIPHQRTSSLDIPTEPFSSRLARRMKPSRKRYTPFIAPLTRVWSPIITRAQWEIVVRSAAVALMFSAVVVGALLAVPVHPMSDQSRYGGYMDLSV